MRFDAAFLLLVGEGLTHAVGRRVGRVAKADLVVLVVGDAAPEADRVDNLVRCAPFAFAEQLGLLGIDAGIGVLAVAAGNMVERVVLRDS